MLSSVSQVVEAANSKLAIFLRSKEDEEASLAIGKKKPKLLLEQGLRFPVGKARWLAEPDFSIPDPFAERPPLENGATSFHFSWVPISRKAVPTFKGRPVQGPFSVAENPALRHAKYIERDGAAELHHAEIHADYLERTGAVEMADWLFGAEEPSADERDTLSGEVDARDGVPSIFSNISDDAFERQKYWRAVERCERQPRVHELILEPDVTPRWWQELETTNVLDPAFKNHALMVAEAYRQWLGTPVPEDGAKKPFVAAPFKVSAERAGEIIMQAQKMMGYDVARPPFEFKSGRGGRIQYRFVASLPHELSAEDRALIVQTLCNHIGGLEERRRPDGTVEKVGMMYTAVIHAPDDSNHRRNYHLHLIAHDRPAKFLEEKGMWDFEYAETYTSSCRKTRTRYPFRQNKIEEVTRSAEDRRNVKTAGLKFIPALRKKFAEITNTVLAANGVERRYDPRTYKDMKVDRQPTEPLGSKAAALERIGVPTFVGAANAIKIWADKERAIRQQVERTAKQRREDQSKLKDEIEEIALSLEPTDRVLLEARKSLRERDQLISEVATDRAALLMFAHMEAKAKSRAERTQQTCRQHLEDIATGTATKSIEASKSAIEQRLKAAIDHVTVIDRALAPYRRDLMLVDRDVARHESGIEALATSVRNAIGVLRRRAEAARSTLGVAAKDPKHADTRVPSEAPKLPLLPDTRAEPANEAGDGSPGAIASGHDHVPASPDESQTRGEEARPNQPPQSGAASSAPDRQEANTTPTGAPDMSHDGEPSPPREDLATEPAHSDAAPELEVAHLKPEAGFDHDQDDSLIEIEVAAPEPALTPMEAAAEEGRQPDTHRHGDHVDPEDGNLPSRNDPAARRRAGNEPPREPRAGREQEQPSAADQTSSPEEIPDAWKGWGTLIDRIARERILIKEIKGKDGTMIYKVPSLSLEEQKLLHARRFHEKTIKRLTAICQIHKREVEKLTRWIRSEHGRDPSLLILEGRSVKLGNVKPSVRTLFGHWERHPDVLTALEIERARRIELANKLATERSRETAKSAPAPAPQPECEMAERIAEAERLYPAPDQVYTREVAEFTRLLRELALVEQIEAAARRIYGKPDAEEDVSRHTPELASAYEPHRAKFDYENLLQISQRNAKKMGK